MRTLFQGLFESFLARRNLTVCVSNQRIVRRARAQPRGGSRAIAKGASFAFCAGCGAKNRFRKPTSPFSSPSIRRRKWQRTAGPRIQRTRFEQVIFRLEDLCIRKQKMAPPECFISYAWGNPEQERWVEKVAGDGLAEGGDRGGAGPVGNRAHRRQRAEIR